MIDLSNVTLWSCVWSDNRDLLDRTIRVLAYCESLCDFGEIIIFHHPPLDCDPCNWKTVQIGSLDLKQWNWFVNKEVPKHVTKDFAMSVHEDGFILEPDLWQPEFLQYDYIGAPWPDHVVGNGGFNIESRRLMEAKMRFPQNTQNPDPSDVFVCRTHRKQFESQGIRFAPEDLALKFSTEQIGNDQPSFGFHGRTASPAKYSLGWKLIEEWEAPSVVLVYVYVAGDGRMEDFSRQFLDSYFKHQPGYKHRTIIVCNNGMPSGELLDKFKQMPDCSFYKHNNEGWDIGGFIAVSRTLTDDMAVYFSNNAFFRKEGWMRRMVDAWHKHGPGFYGSLATFLNKPHLQTSGFWCPPWFVAKYPRRVLTKMDRYNFEHGYQALWIILHRSGYKVKLVTWDGEYDWPDWRKPPNIYRRGNQSNCLTFWRHNVIYENSSEPDKRFLESEADNITEKYSSQAVWQKLL